MSKATKQIEYDYILKEAEHKERKPVDRWFLENQRKYIELCKRVKEGKQNDRDL